MAFDAGFLAAVINEINTKASGARIEKVFQPDKDTVVLSLHCEASRGGETIRLLLNAGNANPRVQFTDASVDNPKAPPMFCMLLRKHLTGGKLKAAVQPGFERVLFLELEARDEMGFTAPKTLVLEIMGKCSNLMLLDEHQRIQSALKLVDITTSRLRQVLPGMTYELPPAQEGKISPFDETEEGFSAAWNDNTAAPDKFFLHRYLGISPLVARELAYGTDGDAEKLWTALNGLRQRLADRSFIPLLVQDRDGSPLEYSFLPIRQYGDTAETVVCDSFGVLCDRFFGQRSSQERMKQRAADILRLLTNTESRLTKKIASQEADLAECSQKDEWKRNGDLITANLYRLKRGMTRVELMDYSVETIPTVVLTLDSRLTPAQNAQAWYKKYNKAKSAEAALTEQIAIARRELVYLDTVFDALTRAETENDLDEIRRELHESGYASKMKGFAPRKQTAIKPLEYRTDGGYRVLCGKNNLQNDYITHKLAARGDLWFHIKGMPGSHVVLFCDDAEPSEVDFTQAATIAAVHSKAPRGQKVEVDYTRIRFLKKPPASKPGYVTFSQNYSAVVVADPAVIAPLAVTKNH